MLPDMVRRSGLPLFLLSMLFMQCAPAGMHTPDAQNGSPRIQNPPEPVYTEMSQYEAALADWVRKAQSPIRFRLAGALQKQWRNLVNESNWAEYARRCTTAYQEDGLVTLTLVYRDYVRLCAALRDAAYRASLTVDEQKVLDNLQKLTWELLRPGMSDFEKLNALHDAIVQRACYDAEAGGDVADILYHGRGSCEAYSSMLCVMLEIAGIPARVVTGEAGGAPHAWNLVKLGREWYHVDCTWDDPLVNDGTRQILSHAYMCNSDAEMATTHSWNRLSYPHTGIHTAGYYRIKGLYFTEFEQFWREAVAACERGESRFEAYLTCYGSASVFQQKMANSPSPRIPVRISWTGPATASGAVVLQFES